MPCPPGHLAAVVEFQRAGDDFIHETPQYISVKLGGSRVGENRTPNDKRGGGGEADLRSRHFLA